MTPALRDGGAVGWTGSPGFTRGYFRWLPTGATCGGADVTCGEADARGRLARGLCDPPFAKCAKGGVPGEGRERSRGRRRRANRTRNIRRASQREAVKIAQGETLEMRFQSMSPPRRGGLNRIDEQDCRSRNCPAVRGRPGASDGTPSAVFVRDESRRPYGAAGPWRGRFPRVSPGAIFIGSLREPAAVGRTLAEGSHGACAIPPFAKCAKDGAPGYFPPLNALATFSNLSASVVNACIISFFSSSIAFREVVDSPEASLVSDCSFMIALAKSIFA